MSRARLVVALDLADAEAALEWGRRLKGHADLLKVGLQLFTAHGPGLVRELRNQGWRIFLDLKIHDIPATAAHAVESAAGLEVELLTLHTSGGAAMLRAAVAARDPAHGPKLLGVTLLTSLGPQDLHQLGWPRQAAGTVARLCRVAYDCGCDGVVASVREAAAVKKEWGRRFLVATPGIRPRGADADDQARVATPAAAAQAGSDYIVVGRPILRAPDPLAAADAILQELETASGDGSERGKASGGD